MTRKLAALALLALLTIAPFTSAQEEPAAQEAAALEFMRTIDEDGVVSLEIASREFAPAEGKGPKVWLVGVAHIADLALYSQHQKLLADFDVVLFESVMPPGSLSIGDVPPAERAAATLARMRFLGSLIERYHAEKGEYPAALDEVVSELAEIDSRLVSILPKSTTDAWGRSLAYSTADAGTFTLLSLGADNAPGGAHADADIAVTDRDDIEPVAVSSEGGLQAELADTLGLAFQLSALSYGQPNFRPSDMTMDQLSAAMTAHNLDAGDLEAALDATSFPAQLMKVLLQFVKVADQMLGGGIADVCRLMIIEVLGSEEITQQALKQFGEGFTDVIVGERNQVVVNDLKEIIEREEGVESVAIYYGAAHMPDFVERLGDQLGYAPTGETKWFEAMKVDLNNSSIPREQLEMMRGMLRKTLRDQMRAMNRE